MTTRRSAKGAFDAFAGTTPPRSDAATVPPDVAEPATPSEADQASAPGKDVAAAPAPAVPAAVAASAAAPVALREPGQVVEILAKEIPEPYQADDDSLDLSARQEEELESCENAIGLAEVTFGLQGKAFQTVRDARLYRETHLTFELYCQDRWKLGSRRVNQLIETWPLALRLGTRFPKLLNERQVRALKPYAARHGEAAAEELYCAVVAVRDRPSGALLERVVAALPPSHDPEKLVEQVREILGSGPRVLPPPESDQDDGRDLFEEELQRLRKVSGRVVETAPGRPESARRFAASLRSLADTVEAKLDGES